MRIELGIVADVGRAIRAMIAACGGRAGNIRRRISAEWREIEGWRAKRSLDFPNSAKEIMPQHAIRRLWEATHHLDPIISTEVGQHQMWAAQHFGFEASQQMADLGGLGTMGYGLPAAIGAQIGNARTRW